MLTVAVLIESFESAIAELKQLDPNKEVLWLTDVEGMYTGDPEELGDVIFSSAVFSDDYGYEAGKVLLTMFVSEPDEEEREEESCLHEWVYTGTAYGGDDESYSGEGRVYCSLCGEDGDG